MQHGCIGYVACNTYGLYQVCRVQHVRAVSGMMSRATRAVSGTSRATRTGCIRYDVAWGAGGVCCVQFSGLISRGGGMSMIRFREFERGCSWWTFSVQDFVGGGSRMRFDEVP